MIETFWRMKSNYLREMEEGTLSCVITESNTENLREASGRLGCHSDPLIGVLIKTDCSRATQASDTTFLEFCVQIGLSLAERTTNCFTVIFPRSCYRLATEGDANQPSAWSA